MRKILWTLAFLAPALAAADDSERLCKSLNLEPLRCYAHWAPTLLNLVNVGVTRSAREEKSFDLAPALKQESDLYAFVLRTLEPGSEKAVALEQVHVYAQESYRAILVRSGVSEEQRKKEAISRRAGLAQRVQKLVR